MRLRYFVLLAGLTLAACGKGDDTNKVEDSTLTPLNGATLIEGTTNDASALETASEANNIAPAAAENATDGSGAPANAM